MQKILIIEDEAPVRQNLVELLDAEGFFPIEASDGEEGVSLAWEMLPDLILCDISMPKMDGFGVLSRLARDPATATIPFIFLTARTEREDLRRGMNLGADDYIMKPFTIEEVLVAIRARLEKRVQIESYIEKKLAELSKMSRMSLPGEMLSPLSVILSYSELLSNFQEASRLEISQICAMSSEILRAGGTLLHTIQNTMFYSDLEAILSDPNRLRLLRDSRVLSAWMTISEMATLKARQDGREGDLRLQVEDSPLCISEMYLQKIVEELLDNAFKYSPLGSPVRVIGEVRPERQQYNLRVSDSGRGMFPDQVAVLAGRMQPGTRPSASMDQGIGLAIVRRLAELHQGSFSLQSQPKQWTVVEVSVPLSD